MFRKNKIYWILLGILLIGICFYNPHFIFSKTNNQKERAKLENFGNGSHVNLYALHHPYLNQADQLNNEKKYDSAILLYNSTAQKFLSEKQWDEYTWVNGYIARLYLYVAGKDSRDALPYLKRSLDSGQYHLKPDNVYLAPTYYYYGLYYFKTNNPVESIKMYQKALTLLKSNSLDSSIYTADNFEAMGDVYLNESYKNLDAETYYLKAIRLRESQPYPANDSDISMSYYNLVTLYDYTGDYDKSQFYCQKAIRMTPFIRNYRSSWLELFTGVTAHLFNKQNKKSKAIEILHNVIAMNVNNHGDQTFLPFYLSSLADIYAEMAVFDSAVTYYHQALEATKSKSVLEDLQLQRAVTSYDLGMLLSKYGHFAEALPLLQYNLAFRTTKQPANTKEIVSAYNSIAKNFYEIRKLDSALKYVQLGINACARHFSSDSVLVVPVARQLDSTFWSYQIIYQKANILKAIFDQNRSNKRLLTAALSYYCLADSLADEFEQIYEIEDSKLRFINSTAALHEQGLACSTQLLDSSGNQKYPEIILRMIENNKSSLLFQNLQEDEYFSHLPLTEKEKTGFREQREQLSLIRSQITSNQNQLIPVTDSSELFNRLVVARNNLDSIQRQLIRKYSLGISEQTKTVAITIKDMTNYARQNRACIIDYFWGQNMVYLMGFFNGISTVISVRTDSILFQNITGFQRQLSKPYLLSTEDSDFAAYQNSAYYLFNHLVKPVFSKLNITTGEDLDSLNLVIIPDGPLWQIPFEAFITRKEGRQELNYGNLDYLVRHCAVSYSYSGKFLIKLKEQHSNPDKPTLLAFGGGFNENDNASLSKYNLPGSDEELQSITQSFKSEIHQGKDATLDIFKKQAPESDILHLALHGTADSAGLLKSKLFFYGRDKTTEEGVLHAYQLYGMTLKARLAVLSACESGTGAVTSGEGVYSMSRVFVLAGCQSVVSSLWRVDDHATASIMGEFYKNLSNGSNLSYSLRKAKLTYIESSDRRNAHPAKWSAFTAFGDATLILSSVKTSNNTSHSTLLWLAIIALLICMPAIYWAIKK